MRKILFLLLAGRLLATDYVVAPSGGDYTTFAALVAAVNLTAGDNVRMQAAAVGGTVTFNERLAPDGSGTLGNPITIYARKGDTVIIRGVNGSTRDYIRLIGFEITHAASETYEGVLLEECTGWLIQNNYIHDLNTSEAGIRLQDDDAGNTHNTIRGNRVDLPPKVGATGLGVLILVDGLGSEGNDNNLIEYNTLGIGNDKTRIGGVFNIIRNNYSTPFFTADLDGITDPHVDWMQLFGSNALFERNFSNQSDTGNAHLWIVRDVSFHGWNHLIARFNVDYKTGGGGPGQEEFPDVYSYNNTHIDGQNQKASVAAKNNYFMGMTASTVTVVGTFRNNIFLRCKNNVSFVEVDEFGSTSTVVQDHNLSYPVGLVPGTGSLAATDPELEDEAALDFRLAAGSPAIAAGSYATLANGAGVAATALTVDDAKYFCDGWEIAEGDWISIGGGPLVQISAINYGTNVITLATADTWADNDTVSMRGMEDFGALPTLYVGTFSISQSQSETYAAGAKTLAATVGDTDTVRMVEFLVDGIPLALDYASAYSAAWTSDGAVHLLTYRAYNMWASATPTEEVSITSNNPSSLTATQDGSSVIDLGWTDNATDETGFYIERGTDGVTYVQVGTAAAAATSYADTGLSPSTQYYYRIRSNNGTYYSAYSNSDDATTAAGAAASAGKSVGTAPLLIRP